MKYLYMSAYRAVSAIQARFPMLTPIEHAIMEHTPTRFWSYFRYSDRMMDKQFMKNIDENRLTTGDTELTKYIRKDDHISAVQRFFNVVGIDENSPIDTLPGWTLLHVYILINICFANKATKCLEAFLKHPFIREALKRLLTERRYYTIRSGYNMLGYIDPSHPIFDVAFIDDPLIMEIICTNPDNERYLFDTFVYATIRGRHYEGIDKLVQLNQELTEQSLSRITELPRGKPEQRFMELCLRGYNYYLLKKRIEKREIFTEISAVPYKLLPLMESVDVDPCIKIFIENAARYGLIDSSLAIMFNGHKDDEIGGLIGKITGWNEKYESSMLEVISFSETEREVLIMAVKNDDIDKLLSLFIHSMDYTDDRIREAFILSILHKAVKCIRGMEIHPDMSETVKSLKVNGHSPSVENNPQPTYGALTYISDAPIEIEENGLFSFILPACSDSSIIAQMYTIQNLIVLIPSDYFNEFRYTLALGSMLYFNIDLYDWVITELYGESEEDFLSELCIRIPSNTDTNRNPLIGAVEAFQLYKKCLEIDLPDNL